MPSLLYGSFHIAAVRRLFAYICPIFRRDIAYCREGFVFGQMRVLREIPEAVKGFIHHAASRGSRVKRGMTKVGARDDVQNPSRGPTRGEGVIIIRRIFSDHSTSAQYPLRCRCRAASRSDSADRSLLLKEGHRL